MHDDMMVYDDRATERRAARSATPRASCTRPQLQRHIALARVRPDLAKVGTRVNLEFTINHRYVQVGAEVARNPMFAPARKTQMIEETAS